MRNVTVDLDTSKTEPVPDTPASAAAEADTVAAAPPVDASAQSEVAPHHTAVPTITTLQAQQPAIAEPPAPSAAIRDEPTAAAPHHNWLLQLGSFADKANAESMARRLKAKGLSASVSAGGRGRARRYRVRIGPLADRAAADKMRVRMMRDGQPSSIVAP